jgi:hypothetical protein
VLVTGYQQLIEVLDLPDPDDRHVLAAANKVGAQLIITNDMGDFPADRLAPWDIETCSADHFTHAMVDLDPERSLRSCSRWPTREPGHRCPSTTSSPR